MRYRVGSLLRHRVVDGDIPSSRESAVGVAATKTGRSRPGAAAMIAAGVIFGAVCIVGGWLIFDCDSEGEDDDAFCFVFGGGCLFCRSGGGIPVCQRRSVVFPSGNGRR